VAHWDFKKGSSDSVSGLSLTLHGTAQMEKGALVLDGKGYAATGPLPIDLAAKTLEARVQLASLDQTGSGVVSVQNEGGVLFDSIVFAERRRGEWLAGSNSFARTLDFDGPVETEADKTPVHLVFAYSEDGTIRCYRNGEPWGDPIRKAALQSYAKGRSEVLLGMRHGTKSAPRGFLKGRILEARLYDRALTAEEARAAFVGGPAPVTREDLNSALGSSGTAQRQRLEADLQSLDSQARELQSLGADLDLEPRIWRDLAHAIVNLKEFIYLK
jgi:hypothetical protein